jgi:hypothetical protein
VVAAAAILSREAILFLPREAIPPVAEAVADAEAAEEAAEAAVVSVSNKHYPAGPPEGQALRDDRDTMT